MNNVNPNIVITIGRQMGSGGRQVGHALAERLGYSYYDKELLTQAAQRAGICEEFFEENDERMPSFFSCFIPFSHGITTHSMFNSPSMIGCDGIYRAQSDLIESLPAMGPCVIVGRSADFVLRHYPRLVSIFISAPLEARVERIMRRQPELSADKARNIALKTDKLRASYYNFYTDSTWGAASTYDLTLDSSRLSIDDIVKIITGYIKLRFK